MIAHKLLFCLLLLSRPLLAQDRTLDRLVHEALDRNPDLAAAEQRVLAERERVPQASSLPDPLVAIGYQNDGFTSLPLGKEGTTWISLMASQQLPWPGKRQAREDQAQAGVALAQARLARLKRTLRADIERAYVGLLFAQARGELLHRQDEVWRQVALVARAKFAAGPGTQVEVVRAELERTRLQQVLATLRWEEQARLLDLNRLALRPVDAPLDISTQLDDLALPVPATDVESRLAAESPEIAVGEATLLVAEQRAKVTRLEQRPDITLTAGLMPRGIGLQPMWLLQVGTTLPVYSATKQTRAIAEADLRTQAGQTDIASLRLQLHYRTVERLQQLETMRAILETYRKDLLPQADAAIQAVMTQYRLGRVPFVAVLEAINAQVTDRANRLATLAAAHSVWIALEEIDLGPTRAVGAENASSAAGATTSAM
jgi:cobalt-zinc-cadmium efflux system outer membrane protein